MRPLTEVWTSATSRMMLIYGALFAVWGIVLLGVVQYETTRYLEGVIDQMIQARINFLAHIDEHSLPATVDNAVIIDTRGQIAVGLFDADGTRVAGNITHRPTLPADGNLYALQAGVIHPADRDRQRARAMAVALPGGRILVASKDTGTIDGLGVILRRGLLWGLSLTLIPGLLGGLLLSRGPARRIRAMAQAIEPIQHGDLSRRLPVSRRGDELDLMAGIVNAMLVEIERLIGEVKGVCDSVAHDLRTPLTHLRARLHRARVQLDGRDEAALMEACLADVDALLGRFRALLRISELEDGQRSACFRSVNIADVLQQVHEFYAPLAEDRGQVFELDATPVPALRGDPQLLFEALANLVGNAIKFTPAGGRIVLRSGSEDGAAFVQVDDNGPGIPESEREAVLLRFYRGDASRSMPGSGLGLSIVNAIARLHGHSLEIGGTDTGARIRLRLPLAGAAPVFAG